MAKKKETVKIKWKDRKHWAWFPFSFTVYKLSDERIYIQTGFFNTHYDETLLYRITDICLERSFRQKFFGTGTIILYTKADAQSTIKLENIKRPKETKDLLSEMIETVRNNRGVVGKEFYSGRTVAEGEENFGGGGQFRPDPDDDNEGFDFHHDHE